MTLLERLWPSCVSNADGLSLPFLSRRFLQVTVQPSDHNDWYVFLGLVLLTGILRPVGFADSSRSCFGVATRVVLIFQLDGYFDRGYELRDFLHPWNQHDCCTRSHFFSFQSILLVSQRSDRRRSFRSRRGHPLRWSSIPVVSLSKDGLHPKRRREEGYVRWRA